MGWPLEWFFGEEVKMGRGLLLLELGMEWEFSNELELLISGVESKREELNWGIPHLMQYQEESPRFLRNWEFFDKHRE